MSIACVSCASNAVAKVGPISPAPVFASHRLTELPDGGALYFCTACALSFRHPTPPQESLDALYQTSSISHWQYHPEKRTDWQLALDWLTRQSHGRNILDVGCFDGAFAEFLGPAWTSFGVEINEEAIQRAATRGVTLVGRNISELADLEATYDAVVAFDVIEHVPDPAQFLATMSRLTTPGGSIVIASGNTEAPSWKWMGSSYWYCTIPEHLTFISKTWCRRIAPDLNLELMRIDTYSHEQNITLKLTLRELATNTLYRVSPGLFAALRRAGLGDKDTRLHEELAYHPPTWTSAKDHLIAIFRKA